MTEEQWAACSDPEKMLELLKGKVSDRKLWLFACSNWRVLSTLKSHPVPEELLELSDRRADGLVTFEDLLAAEAHYIDAVRNGELPYSIWRLQLLFHGVAYSAAVFSMPSVAEVLEEGNGVIPVGVTFRECCDRIRCVFGNPCPRPSRETKLKKVALGLLELLAGHPYFHDAHKRDEPIPLRLDPFDSEWRTSTAVALAQQMYDSRDFSAMPILADALQDAGCDSTEILDHCRGPGPHVRGCWVVDLVLGKS